MVDEYYGDLHDEAMDVLLHFCEFPENSNDEIRLCLRVAETLIGAGHLHDGCWANACAAFCGAVEQLRCADEHLKRQTLEDGFISLAREVERGRENPRSDAAVIDHAKLSIQLAIDRKQIHCERKVFWRSADHGDESAEAVWTFPAKLAELLQSDPCTLTVREWSEDKPQAACIIGDDLPTMVPPDQISLGNEVTNLQKIPWRLLDVIIKSPGQRAEIGNVMEAVWPYKTVEESTFKTTVSRVNSALGAIGFIRRISQKSGWVRIE